MTQILFTPSFLRQFNKLPPELQDEVDAAVLRFQSHPRDRSLKLHRLKGKLRRFFSFSVNYRYRIVCQNDAHDVWALLSVGDHDVYR
ncbi:MAG: hypothetical protein V1926_00450 [Candidatus Peregrinibacteria bacterium]